MLRKLMESRLRRVGKKITTPQTGWLDVFPAVMGKADGTVRTSVNGIVWVRNVLNGQELTVYNSVAPTIAKIQVEVGKRVDQPGLWQIKGMVEPFSTPSAGGKVAYHAEQHQYPNGDTVWVDRRQIVQLNVLVKNAEDFIVRVYGSVMRTTSGIGQINTQDVDLSSYVPTAGAVFVTIQSDEDGVLSVVEGDVFESPFVATYADVPDVDADKYMLAFVLLHESMTELSNDDIRIPHLFHGGGTTFVIWGNISGTLSDQTDLQDALDGKADVDHTHEPESEGSGHEHAITRWVSGGGTTFEFPDYVQTLELVTLNGLEEDATVYSLSSNRDQLVFDSAITAGTVIQSHYVPAAI